MDGALHEHEGAAQAQRGEDLHHGHVEADRACRADPAEVALAEDLVPGGQHGRAAAVPDRHPLGRSRGARGVDHVGGVGGYDRYGPLPGLGRHGPVQHHQGRARRAVLPGRGRGQQQARATVPDHELQPLGRVPRIQRHIAGAGAQDGQDGDEQAGRALDADADRDPGSRALGDQPLGQLAGALVQFAVGQRPGVGVDRDGCRGLPGLFDESAVQGLGHWSVSLARPAGATASRARSGWAIESKSTVR